MSHLDTTQSYNVTGENMSVYGRFTFRLKTVHKWVTSWTKRTLCWVDDE